MTTKGHGRLEQRAVWVSSDLAGYSSVPGLSNVIKARRVKHLKRGEWVENSTLACPNMTPNGRSPWCRDIGALRTACSTSRTTASVKTAM